MTSKVELGAPSLTGKDANEVVAVEFAKAKYPLKVVITNLMPRDVVFPEVEGLFLRHVGNESGRTMTVDIDSADQFQRLASSIEQIAELNGYAAAITIEAVEPVIAVKGKTTSAPAAPVQI